MKLRLPALITSGALKSEGEHGAESEAQTVLVEAGQTSHADVVRTNGQHICGKLDKAKASSGYIFVKIQ